MIEKCRYAFTISLKNLVWWELILYSTLPWINLPYVVILWLTLIVYGRQYPHNGEPQCTRTAWYIFHEVCSGFRHDQTLKKKFFLKSVVHTCIIAIHKVVIQEDCMLYSAVLLLHCQFSLKSSQYTRHSLPIRARYAVSFVSLTLIYVLLQPLQCFMQYCIMLLYCTVLQWYKAEICLTL